jgi:hypothetical protein
MLLEGNSRHPSVKALLVAITVPLGLPTARRMGKAEVRSKRCAVRTPTPSGGNLLPSAKDFSFGHHFASKDVTPQNVY